MGKKKTKNQSTGKRNVRLEQLEEGIALCTANPLFGRMGGYIRIRDSQTLGKNNVAIVTKQGEILVNQDVSLSPRQWSYAIAHCKLHLAFGHFDKEKMPENCEKLLWNFACDIFVAKFLADIKFGEAICPNPVDVLSGSLNDERINNDTLCIIRAYKEWENKKTLRKYGFLIVLLALGVCLIPFGIGIIVVLVGAILVAMKLIKVHKMKKTWNLLTLNGEVIHAVKRVRGRS